MENMAMEKGYQHWPADIQVIMGVMIMVAMMMMMMRRRRTWVRMRT